MTSIRPVSVTLLAALACLAAAKPPFLKVFMDTYRVSPTSALGKARCLNCHAEPGPPRLNSYGRTVQSALAAAHARMVTVEILRSIERKHGEDGISFVSKIKKDKLPGVSIAAPRPTNHKSAHGRGLGLLEPSSALGSSLLLLSAVGVVIRPRKT